MGQMVVIFLFSLMAMADGPAETGVVAIKQTKPEFVLDVKNGKIAQEFMKENPWYQGFKQTSLFDGLLMRLSPVLFQLGENEAGTWKGRLLEFVYSEVLSGRPLRVQYYHRSKLVSPFSVTIVGLNLAQKKTIETIIQYSNRFKGQTPKYKIENTEYSITPVTIKYQKFAVSFHGDCFSFSRDPVAVALASQDCPKDGEFNQDMKLRLNSESIFPSLASFGRKFLGVGEWLETNWKFKKGFEPVSGNIALEQDHLLKDGKDFSNLLEAVPSDAQFLVSAVVPTPDKFTDLGIFLKMDRTALKARPGLPITLVHLGMVWTKNTAVSHAPDDYGYANRAPKEILVPATALLVPTLENGDELYLGLAKVFSEKNLFETHYRKVCGNLVAISPNESALQKIESACAKKIPALRDLSAKSIGLFKKPGAFVLFTQPGLWLENSLEFGWKRLAKEGQTQTPEIVKSKEFLHQIPSITIGGKVQGNNLLLEGQL